MEQLFGADFSSVRLHAGERARRGTRSVHAAAYTFGSHIVVDAARPRDTTESRFVLAHELAHVLQQQATSDHEAVELGEQRDRAEAEANDAAHSAVAHHLAERARRTFRERIDEFVERHPDGSLSDQRRSLAEEGFRVEAATPLGTVRRMARAESPEMPTRESLGGAELTDDETYVRDVFRFFYPDNPYTGPINDDAKRVAAHLVHAATEQSDAMHLVPRPPARPTPGWLVKEAVQAAYRALKEEGIYEAVRVNVARNYRSSFEELRNGIPVTL